MDGKKSSLNITPRESPGPRRRSSAAGSGEEAFSQGRGRLLGVRRSRDIAKKMCRAMVGAGIGRGDPRRGRGPRRDKDFENLAGKSSREKRRKA